MLGLFGKLFDFDGDGKLNVFEIATECMFIEEMLKEEQEEEIEYPISSVSYKDDLLEEDFINEYDEKSEDDSINEYDEEFEELMEDDQVAILEEVGLDYYELELMDPFERDMLLEEVGLNPYDFDFI